MTPSPDTAAIERVIDIYCSAWREADAEQRLAIIESVWEDGATYTDPGVRAVGSGELSDHIGRVLTRRAGAQVLRTSAVDVHHNLVRFTWHVVMPDGSILRDGIDFAEVSPNGKLRYIVGFFGSLAPLAEG